MSAETEFPLIVHAAQVSGDGLADTIADRWRAKGYLVRVFDRSVRAGDLHVVVLDLYVCILPLFPIKITMGEMS